MNGKVIRNTGSLYVVRTPEGEVKCKVKGNFRIKGIRTTNPVAVGDEVEIGAPGPDGVAFITAAFGPFYQKLFWVADCSNKK